MELDQVPDHLLVLGGGYVGVGVRPDVPTLWQQGHHRPAGHATARARGSGHRRRGCRDPARGWHRGPAGHRRRGSRSAAARPSRSTCGGPDGERTLTGSHLLVATGRCPNAEALNLAAAGVATMSGGFIRGQRAAGDQRAGHLCARRYQRWPGVHPHLLRRFPHHPHQSDRGRQRQHRRPTHPLHRLYRPSAWAGRHRPSRRRDDRAAKIRVAKMPMSSVARALEVDESRGLMKAIVDAESGSILGCAILGIEGGELMSMLQVAMLGNLPTPRSATGSSPTPPSPNPSTTSSPHSRTRRHPCTRRRFRSSIWPSSCCLRAR